MPDLAFELVRDARGSLVHVRDRRSGKCVGCIEVGLFELVKVLIVAETREAIAAGDRLSVEVG